MNTAWHAFGSCALVAARAGSEACDEPGDVGGVDIVVVEDVREKDGADEMRPPRRAEATVETESMDWSESPCLR